MKMDMKKQVYFTHMFHKNEEMVEFVTSSCKVSQKYDYQTLSCKQ
jgi:hypothetical protein